MMGSTPYDTDEDWESEGELDLADDESLPWLEAADDEGDAAGFDTSRLVMLGTLAITLLAAVVGGIWFVTSQVSNEPEADGSLIEAPDGPYKTRPENPVKASWPIGPLRHRWTAWPRAHPSHPRSVSRQSKRRSLPQGPSRSVRSRGARMRKPHGLTSSARPKL